MFKIEDSEIINNYEFRLQVGLALRREFGRVRVGVT